jgi:hypothetical protein
MHGKNRGLTQTWWENENQRQQIMLNFLKEILQQTNKRDSFHSSNRVMPDLIICVVAQPKDY